MKLFLLFVGAAFVVLPARFASDWEQLLVISGAIMLGVWGLFRGMEIERKYPTKK